MAWSSFSVWSFSGASSSGVVRVTFGQYHEE
jgi:hypothetical protein